MMINPSVIRQAISIDFDQIVTQDTRLSWSMRGGRGSCPLHGGKDRNFSIYRRDDGTWGWTCHSRCGSGNPITYLRKRDQIGFKQAVALLTSTNPHQQRRPLPPPVPRIPVEKLPPLDREAIQFYQRRAAQTSTGLTGTDWWVSQGISTKSIDRFHLGYCDDCPMAWDESDPGNTYDSATIPVTYHGRTVQIRHRMLKPWKNAKYLPHVPDRGSLLFNRDTLEVDGDGVPRTDRDECIIVEGEKKVMALCDRGVDDLIPVVSATAGIRSWRSERAEEWYEWMSEYERVFVLFDTDMSARAYAERTARMFGRRGYTIHLPGKIDDLLVDDEARTLFNMMHAMQNAVPVWETYRG